VVSEYRPGIDGHEPTAYYLALLAGRPVGFIQTYLLADHPEWERALGTGPGVAGVDLFIADEELLYRGLGPRLLRTFLLDIVFTAPTTTACIACPDIRNRASIRAFEKAGFVCTGTIEVPDEPGPERVMRVERAALGI